VIISPARMSHSGNDILVKMLAIVWRIDEPPCILQILKTVIDTIERVDISSSCISGLWLILVGEEHSILELIFVTWVIVLLCFLKFKAGIIYGCS